MNISLLNDDCINILEQLPEQSIDAIITDPPYGTSACKWDSVIHIDKMWFELERIIKPTGAIVLFGIEPFSSMMRMSNLKHYRYDWVWVKDNFGNFLNIKHQPGKKHENIMVFSLSNAVHNAKNKMAYYPVMSKGKPYKIKAGRQKQEYSNSTVRTPIKQVTTVSKGTRYPTTILEFTKDKEKYHPTQKPVALMEYLVKTYTKEDEVVLDFTMGSGSTGVACVNTNRGFIGIEKDEEYFELAKRRIMQAKRRDNGTKSDSI